MRHIYNIFRAKCGFRYFEGLRTGTFFFALSFLLLLGLAIFRIKPASEYWQYALAPDSYNHHHTIISVIDDLYRNPEFLKGDLVVEAVKNYFLLYKYIQIFFVNVLGNDLGFFVNLMVVSGVLLNFIGMGYFSYVLTGKRYAILLSLLLLVASPEPVLLDDATVNYMRVISQGICWISIALFFRQKYLPSLVVCASAFIFHYGTPFYLVLIYFFYFISRIRDFTARDLLVYTAVFVSLSALVSVEFIGLLLAGHDQKGFDYDIWKKIILDTGSFWSYKLALNSLIQDMSANIHILKNAILNNMVIPLFFFCTAAFKLKHRKEFIFIFIGYLLVQFIHIMVFDIFFIPALVRPVLINSSYFMPFFIISIYGSLIAEFWDKKEVSYMDFLCICLISIIYFVNNFKHPLYLFINIRTIVPVIFIMFALFKLPVFMKKESWAPRKRFLPVAVIVLLVFSLAVFYVSEVNGNIRKAKRYNAWMDIELWVSANTKRTDRLIVFAGPNEFHGLRIYSKRSVMGFKPFELHFIAFLNPNLTRAATREFTALWDVPKIDGIPTGFSSFDLFPTYFSILNTVQKEGLLKLKMHYPDLSYIITEGREIQGLKPVYRNGRYNIFEIN